ncbi:hypothetical protein Oscil6304_1427 [Oscillatoria acuminata PCC 6304]|uniref:Uncharacterized protein n=1 Tax=Oscillatoria acuminata PCC 6304 TaxID=56110 RepID=K9TGI1_9CYAN|nr:hypothetical protein Oscil6304_1427 [Oscillatoria acuminata PCC 6304]
MTNQRSSLVNVGAQCLRPKEGLRIAPLQIPSFQLNSWMIYILQSPNQNVGLIRESTLHLDFYLKSWVSPGDKIRTH